MEAHPALKASNYWKQFWLWQIFPSAWGRFRTGPGGAGREGSVGKELAERAGGSVQIPIKLGIVARIGNPGAPRQDDERQVCRPASLPVQNRRETPVSNKAESEDQHPRLFSDLCSHAVTHDVSHTSAHMHIRHIIQVAILCLPLADVSGVGLAADALGDVGDGFSVRVSRDRRLGGSLWFLSW